MKIHVRTVARVHATRAIDVDGGLARILNAEVVDLDAVSIRLDSVKSALLSHTTAYST